MVEQDYELDVSGPAARVIQCELSEAVASAVVEFITGALLETPYRVGGELVGDLAGKRSARRGAYRVLYGVDESRRVVVVLRVEHRADVYRHADTGDGVAATTPDELRRAVPVAGITHGRMSP